jgi:hypothetical protein
VRHTNGGCLAVIAAISVLFLLVPEVVSGQSPTPAPTPSDAARARLHLHAAGGPTVIGGGYVLSGAVGYSPASRLELLLNVERIHLPFRVRDGFSRTRGGTLTFVGGEVRVALLRPDRVSPFVVAGAGGGVARPNVNAQFPDPVTNSLRVGYIGGGVRIPLRGGFYLWGDGRAMLALEGNDSALAMLPIRAGLSWGF